MRVTVMELNPDQKIEVASRLASALVQGRGIESTEDAVRAFIQILALLQQEAGNIEEALQADKPPNAG